MLKVRNILKINTKLLTPRHVDTIEEREDAKNKNLPHIEKSINDEETRKENNTPETHFNKLLLVFFQQLLSMELSIVLEFLKLF